MRAYLHHSAGQLQVAAAHIAQLMHATHSAHAPLQFEAYPPSYQRCCHCCHASHASAHVYGMVQVVDDILDFTQSTEQLGKPQGQDLATGNLTAPVIYALQNPDVRDELLQIIDSEFVEGGSLERALELVEVGGGIEGAWGLARREADAARGALDALVDCPSKHSLGLMADYVLERAH